LRRGRRRQRNTVPVPVRDRRARRPRVLTTMTRIPIFAAALCLAGVLAAARRAAAALTVVTTTSDLAAIVAEVGGDKVSVTSLAKGYQDPPFVGAKPSFVLLLNKAQLLVVVGKELEIAWLPPLVTQSRNARIQP